jgi:hypothetical protein
MRLYGIRGQWSEEPEITVVGTRLPALEGVHVRRIDGVRPGDVHRRLGVPVLAPPLALLLLLLGAREAPARVENAAHDMVFQRLTTKPKLLDTLDAYGGPGRRGTRSYREAVASLPEHGATQTRLELDIVRLARAGGLPPPALQHPAAGVDGGIYRLDVAWVEWLLDVETDGDRWHLSRADRARDRARDAALSAAGWAVLRFGSADVHEHPARTLATIRRSLLDRQRHAPSIRQRTG